MHRVSLDGIVTFWELNSAATAEAIINDFVTAVAAGDVETAKSLLDLFVRTGGRLLTKEIADTSSASLELVGEAVEAINALSCSESAMDEGQRISKCELSVQTASGPRDVLATVTVIEGLIRNWAE